MVAVESNEFTTPSPVNCKKRVDGDRELQRAASITRLSNR